MLEKHLSKCNYRRRVLISLQEMCQLSWSLRLVSRKQHSMSETCAAISQHRTFVRSQSRHCAVWHVLRPAHCSFDAIGCNRAWQMRRSRPGSALAQAFRLSSSRRTISCRKLLERRPTSWALESMASQNSIVSLSGLDAQLGSHIVSCRLARRRALMLKIRDLPCRLRPERPFASLCSGSRARR